MDLFQNNLLKKPPTSSTQNPFTDRMDQYPTTTRIPSTETHLPKDIQAQKKKNLFPSDNLQFSSICQRFYKTAWTFFFFNSMRGSFQASLQIRVLFFLLINTSRNIEAVCILLLLMVHPFESACTVSKLHNSFRLNRSPTLSRFSCAIMAWLPSKKDTANLNGLYVSSLLIFYPFSADLCTRKTDHTSEIRVFASKWSESHMDRTVQFFFLD